LTATYAERAGLAEEQELDPSKQNTLKTAISFSGKGLFTAEKATLTIHPAEPGTGYVFQRSDLPGKPSFPADLQHVVSTPRCTILGTSECTVQTVEHILSALKGLGVMNAHLELNGPEVPIMDGSAAAFVEGILQAGIVQQEEQRKVHYLQNSVSWIDGEVQLIALPAKELTIRFTMHFPQSKVLLSQYHKLSLSPRAFTEDIAPCRTFCVYEEILPLIEQGFIKGGGLDNAVIIKEEEVVNPEGLRFEDEMVRHKVLDLIGDLSLIPDDFVAQIIAIRSGHASNVAFAHQLYDQIKMEIS
jgi:UDP-3-O-[3-hydroxymyristoyl] N-acetylglucosamine deacetylase